MGITYTTIRVRNPIEGTEPEEVEVKVDTGATMLVLPEEVVRRHRFPEVRRQTVMYADGRRAEKRVVGAVEVEVLGRKGWFEAVVEEKKDYGLLGAIVLEALDLIVEPRTKGLYPNPRSPEMPMAEIE
ncbi:MAG: hypothetical protein DSZ24_01020 [Thermodesulfatator sp.]|nr:MAG: hypothetical protein DSZ24_01020 [Thermodesulfatator sp.]